MLKVFITILMMGAAGAAISSGASAQTGGDIPAAPEATTINEFEPTAIVYRCKINGRWRAGRCPRNRAVNCVHHRTGKFRHAGPCRSASR